MPSGHLRRRSSRGGHASRVLVGAVWWVAGCIPAAAVDVAGIPPGHWVEVPDSALTRVAVGPSVGGSIAKITAWSGAALDAEGNRLLVWGGGHSDYAGNEVYAFDLNTLRWERLSEPSRPDKAKSPLYPDGQPRARHTYNYVEYVPRLRRLVSFGGSGAYPVGGGEFTRELSTFDPAERRWVTGVLSPVPAGGKMIGAHARVDPRSGDVFFLPSQRAALMRYSPADDRWRTGSGPVYVRVHATAAIDPERRYFVLIGSGTEPQALMWNLDRLERPRDLRPLTSGDKAMEQAYAPGFDYHPPTRKFLAWGGGQDVYVLDPDNWEWTRRSPAPGNAVNPGPHLPTGTYGRFRYVPRLDVFVLMNGANGNVFVYRLAPP
jgi:hypothetical protein